MISVIKLLIQIFMIMFWVAGVVIANGFWSTLFAVFIPFWSWYLVIERVLSVNGYL